MLINFARSPKLRYCGRSKKGKKKLYHFLDKFKRDDCFLTVSPLENNNTRYLIKYITKGHAYPLARKFSCPRNLDRSRLQGVVRIGDEYSVRLEDYVRQRGLQSYND